MSAAHQDVVVGSFGRHAGIPVCECCMNRGHALYTPMWVEPGPTARRAQHGQRVRVLKDDALVVLLPEECF